MIMKCFLAIFFVVATHFIGAGAVFYPIILKEDTQKNEQLHLGDKVCVLSFAHESWECGRGDKANRGLVVKESGAMVTFNNRVTGWIRARKASHVIYPGGGIKMVEEGGRVVFRHVESHSEASFPKQATDTMASGTPQTRTIDFVQRDFVDSDTKQIADHRYEVWHFGKWLFHHVEAGALCTQGVGLVSNGDGQLSWKVFRSKWSKTARKAVAAVCLDPPAQLSNEDGMAAFTQATQQKTLPVKLLLDLSTKVPIGFYYIPYRPDGSGDQEPGVVKVPAEQPCSLVYQSEKWECQQIPKRRGLCGLRRGLVLKLASDKKHKGVLKYTRLSSIGSKDYAAFIVAGKKVTITRSPPGYVTFTDQATRKTARFAILAHSVYLAARTDDQAATAFAQGAIDARRPVSLWGYQTDANYKKEPHDFIVESRSGQISYDGQQWVYTAGLPANTQKGGFAVWQTPDMAASVQVRTFDKDRPVDAVAAVYLGDSDDMTMAQAGTGVQIHNWVQEVTLLIQNRQSLHLFQDEAYAAAEVPFHVEAQPPSTTVPFWLHLKPPPALGSLKWYDLTMSESDRWKLEHVNAAKVSSDNAPFLILKAHVRPFDDIVVLELSCSQDALFSPEVIAIITAGGVAKARVIDNNKYFEVVHGDQQGGPSVKIRCGRQSISQLRAARK